MTPVQKLLHAVAVVRKGNLAHRVAVKENSHEMNALLISFNAMLVRCATEQGDFSIVSEPEKGVPYNSFIPGTDEFGVVLQ